MPAVMDVRTLGSTWASVAAGFRWQIPERFNIAADTVDRQPGHAVALIHEDEAGAIREYTFADIRAASARLANALTGLGLARGDRVAILLPQTPETAVAHVAAYRAGLLPCRCSCCSARTRSIPAARFGRAGARDRPRELAQGCRDPRRPARPARGHRRGRRRRGRHAGLRGDARAGVLRRPGGRHRGGRPRDHHLHLGHDRAAEGRAARPSLPARAPARCPAPAGGLPAAGRSVLDPGGLGLDRRPVRRPVPGVALRRPGCRVPLPPLRPGARDGADGAPPRAERVPAADGAQAPAPGDVARPGGSRAAVGRQWRRDARWRAPRLGPRDARRDDQRVLRPDRVQPDRLELVGAAAGPSGLDGPAGAGPRGGDPLDEDGAGAGRESRARSRCARRTR